MRKLSCMLWILLLGIASNAQSQYFYYYQGQKQYLELDTKHLFVSVLEQDTVYSFASDRIEQTPFRVDIPERVQSKTIHKRFWTKLSFEENMSEREYLGKLSEIKNSRSDIIVSPYFRENVGLSNFFYVKLKSLSDTILLRQEAEKEQVIIAWQNEFMPLLFIVSVTASSRYNAMEAANHFYETGLFEYTEPDCRRVHFKLSL